MLAPAAARKHQTIRKATDRVQKHRLYPLLQQLERACIHYSLTRVRDDTVMIQAVVPGRRYEIEVFSDGSIEVEIFGTTVDLRGEKQWTNFWRTIPMIQTPPPNFAVERTRSARRSSQR